MRSVLHFGEGYLLCTARKNRTYWLWTAFTLRPGCGGLDFAFIGLSWLGLLVRHSAIGLHEAATRLCLFSRLAVLECEWC